MTNNLEFVPYDEALALRKLGFDEPCLGYYFGKDKEVYTSNEHVKAPFTPDLNSKVMFEHLHINRLISSIKRSIML